MLTLWRKSSRSYGNGACVEMRSTLGRVYLRDSKDPYRVVMELTGSQWPTLRTHIKNGKFDGRRNGS